MAKMITEILDEINADPTTIAKYKDNGALKILFEYGFDPSKKFVLPEGIPPFKEDPAPLGMSPGNLLMEMRRLYIFCRTDLNQLRKESLFVQLLENIHPLEARLMLAVKDQTIHKLYKKVTHKLVYEAGLVSVAPPEKVKKERKKSVTTGQEDLPEAEVL